jgi:hypothetical protein
MLLEMEFYPMFMFLGIRRLRPLFFDFWRLMLSHAPPCQLQVVPLPILSPEGEDYTPCS